MSGKLIICPTPLGNLGDMTQRALDALESADTVCAEDTRVTGKLLAAYDIANRLERLDENALSTQTGRIVDRIAAGETIAYCSDAGMPGVSDPGLRLVRAAREADVMVEVLPGPTAVATAYVASGSVNPHFYFGGFFPRKASERTETLESLRSLNAALVFYESPKRLVSALASIAETFPDRVIAVCRELTKLHEEVVRAETCEALRMFSEREQTSSIKGEIVLVIDGVSEQEAALSAAASIDDAKTRAALLKSAGGYSKKDITALLQAEFGISRNEAYEIALG
ncbi:MAG: 16S rRNA (cytidine(1402)-2'-O)-methyltransferase [Raoultibacter sp.]